MAIMHKISELRSPFRFRINLFTINLPINISILLVLTSHPRKEQCHTCSITIFKRIGYLLFKTMTFVFLQEIPYKHNSSDTWNTVTYPLLLEDYLFTRKRNTLILALPEHNSIAGLATHFLCLITLPKETLQPYLVLWLTGTGSTRIYYYLYAVVQTAYYFRHMYMITCLSSTHRLHLS